MPDPMYRQIAEDLRQKIESGELGHGDQLPTELELRERYEASRNTVRDAVKWLTTRGLVETRPGQGTFVVDRDKITVRAPDADETAFFRLPDDGRVAVFEILRTGFDEQGTPIRLTVSVYPADRNQFAVHIGRVPDLAPIPTFG
jgi:DNA-binding GntR family transcriptional regulator